VVAVDGEHGQRDVVVWVVEVDAAGGEAGGGVGEDLHGDGAVAQAAAGEDLHGLDHRLAGGLVVMEEVAAKEDQVGALLLRDLEDLVEGGKRVVAADLVLLPHALRRDSAAGGGGNGSGAAESAGERPTERAARWITCWPFSPDGCRWRS
jgi:hypothetical protein